MRQVLILALTASLILIVGCASVFNGRYQKVAVNEPSVTLDVYVDGEKIDPSEPLKVKRDYISRQVRVEREGYKTESIVGLFCRQQKNHLPPIGRVQKIIIVPSPIGAV